LLGRNHVDFGAGAAVMEWRSDCKEFENAEPFSYTPTPGPLYRAGSMSTWVDHVRRHAASQTDRRIYTFLADGEHQTAALTFGELDRRARSLAVMLRARASVGDRVLLVCPPGLDYIVGFFGTLYAGMVAVTAFQLDAARRAEQSARLERIARDCSPAVAITAASLECGLAPASIALDRLDLESADRWLAPEITADTLALLQYTSGSTTDPRGVMLTHGAMLANAEAQRHGWRTTEATVGVSWLPLHHDLGVLTCLLQPTYVGFSSVLMPPHAFFQRPARWLEAITRYRGTFAGGPNFAFEVCTRKVSDLELAQLDLSSWDIAFNGGEPVRPATIAAFVARFGRCGFAAEAMYPCYGLAEANFVAGARTRRAPVVRAVGGRELVSNGAPTQRLRIVDASGADCARGEVGEIVLRGSSVGLGYWGQPAFGDGFATGDLAVLDVDDELFITGRRKDLIIVRGANHYPQDLEATAECAHTAARPGCGAAFAIDRGDREVIVFVQELADRASASGVADAIRAAIVASHGVELEAVVLVRAGTIPKTTSGKIRRSACRDAFLAGALAEVARAGRAPSPVRAARSEVERWLVETIGRRVGGPVSTDVPFVQLGIDSLAAVELSAELEQWLGTPVPPTALYAHPTIAELARVAKPLKVDDAVLAKVDGVLLPGSVSNVHPTRYGVAPSPRAHPHDEVDAGCANRNVDVAPAITDFDFVESRTFHIGNAFHSAAQRSLNRRKKSSH
jgi:acyl-CoA synthetase (AMP-forming)/AMP-acid ligase II/acyl carrier protein